MCDSCSWLQDYFRQSMRLQEFAFYLGICIMFWKNRLFVKCFLFILLWQCSLNSFSVISVKKFWPYVKLCGSQTTPTNMRIWCEWWERLSQCWRERSGWAQQISFLNVIYFHIKTSFVIFKHCKCKDCVFMHVCLEPHTARLQGGASVSAPSGETDHSPVQLHLWAVAALLCSCHTTTCQTGLCCTTAYTSTTSLW